MAKETVNIGLLVRSGPFKGRSSRDQLDIALAAACLDFHLELFFIGEGVLQLLADRNARAGSLPGGVKAWKSLPGISSVNAWVAAGVPESRMLESAGALLDIQAASPCEMARRLARCDRVLVV